MGGSGNPLTAVASLHRGPGRRAGGEGVALGGQFATRLTRRYSCSSESPEQSLFRFPYSRGRQFQQSHLSPVCKKRHFLKLKVLLQNSNWYREKWEYFCGRFQLSRHTIVKYLNDNRVIIFGLLGWQQMNYFSKRTHSGAYRSRTKIFGSTPVFTDPRKKSKNHFWFSRGWCFAKSPNGVDDRGHPSERPTP